jgi:hypothetical protein
MKLGSVGMGIACALAALVSASASACGGTDDIHETEEARSKGCYDCHATAYQVVQTPKHVGVYPTTCADCHSTTGWIPAAGGHPESKFPITTGSHANKAIGCADCHIASRGSDANGVNCDCVHCHIGAHNTPAIDAVHSGVAGYAGSALPATPATPGCLASGCHPSG